MDIHLTLYVRTSLERPARTSARQQEVEKTEPMYIVAGIKKRNIISSLGNFSLTAILCGFYF